mmetsp:Transcript_27736/g.53499  ORF Transcript_27736/g.53499 Transcript_27736/m.53499 type:complete len:588 (-) Transcript_27736:94-1857(-)
MGGARRREADSREPSRERAKRDRGGESTRRRPSDSREHSRRDRRNDRGQRPQESLEQHSHSAECVRRRDDSKEAVRRDSSKRSPLPPREREKLRSRSRSRKKESADFSTRAGAIAGSLSGAMGRRKPAQEDEDEHGSPRRESAKRQSQYSPTDDVAAPQRQTQRGAADDFAFEYYDAEQQQDYGAGSMLQHSESRRVSEEIPKNERRKSPETSNSRREDQRRAPDESSRKEDDKRRARSNSRNARRDKRPQEDNDIVNTGVMATLSKVGAPDYSRGPNPMLAFREFLEREPVASKKYSEPHKSEKSGRKLSTREREEQMVLERFAKRQRVKEERKYLVQHGVAALSTKRLRHYDADSESSSTSSRTRRRKGKGVKAITDVARNTDRVETVKADPAAAKAAMRAAASASTPEGVAAAKAAALIWGPAAAFQCGSRVRLVGLKEHSTLNGAVGRVLAPTEGTSPQVPGTVRVMLDTGTEISAKPEFVEAIKMGSSESSLAAPPARTATPCPAASGGVLALQDSDKKEEAELVFASPPAVVQKRVPAKVPTMEELIEKGLELKRRRQAMEQQRNSSNADAAKATSMVGEG